MMKIEDFHDIALKVMRNDGKNNWVKLQNVCSSMNINLCPVYIANKIQHKCQLYLNNYCLPEYGIGKDVLQSSCDAVDKFLHQFINLKKVCSTSTVLNMRTFIIKSKFDETIKLESTLDKCDKKHKLLGEIVNFCVSHPKGDLSVILTNYCKEQGINFETTFTICGEQFGCNFLFNGMRYKNNVMSHSKDNAGRILAGKLIEEYTLNYSTNYDRVIRMLISVALDSQAMKRECIIEILQSKCQYFNISLDTLTSCSENNIHSCTLLLNSDSCPVIGEGTNAREAYSWAVEKFFVKYFSTPIYEKINYAKLYNRIALFCQSNKFGDSWKTLCNGCKLLGYTFKESFYEENSLFSCSFSIEGILCDIIGKGITRNESANNAAQQFMEKYFDLKKLAMDDLDKVRGEDLFKFVATMCVNSFWSKNWEILSDICEKNDISLIKIPEMKTDGKWCCSMSIGIHFYENSIMSTDQEFGFNLLVQHFFTKYGTKQNILPKEVVKKANLIGEKTVKPEKSIPISDTLSNVNRIKIIPDVSNDKLSSSLIPDKIITENSSNCQVATNINNEKMLNIFHKIVRYCQTNQSKDEWKTLCNACKSLNYRIYEKFAAENSKIVCTFYIESKRVDLVGKAFTRSEAAISVAKQFLEKYSDDKIIEELPVVKNTDLSKEKTILASVIDNPPTEMITSEANPTKLVNSRLNNDGNNYILKKIADFCQFYRGKDEWKTLSNSCRALNYKFVENFTERDNEFICTFYIENQLMNFTGKGRTRNIAGVVAAQQFIQYFRTTTKTNLDQISKQTSNSLLFSENVVPDSFRDIEIEISLLPKTNIDQISKQTSNSLLFTENLVKDSFRDNEIEISKLPKTNIDQISKQTSNSLLFTEIGKKESLCDKEIEIPLLPEIITKELFCDQENEASSNENQNYNGIYFLIY